MPKHFDPRFQKSPSQPLFGLVTQRSLSYQEGEGGSVRVRERESVLVGEGALHDGTQTTAAKETTCTFSARNRKQFDSHVTSIGSRV